MTRIPGSSRLRLWLAKAPQLLTAYLAWANRRGLAARHGLRFAVASIAAWMFIVARTLQADPAAALVMLASLHRHALFLGTLCALGSAALVSRRRALNKTEASRSWTAALPVGRAAARWQALAIESAPAWTAVCILGALFGTLSAIAALHRGIPAPLFPWAVMTVGVVLGAALGFLRSAPKEQERYERSRYVPHRRRSLTPIPAGSLSALGMWPVRQMFASAQPKAVARASIPVMVLMPMGSTADVAMLVLCVLGLAGALTLLVAAVISVRAAAARWVKPLPLDSGLFARRLLTRPMLLMLGAVSAEIGLLWVLSGYRR